MPLSGKSSAPMTRRENRKSAEAMSPAPPDPPRKSRPDLAVDISVQHPGWEKAGFNPKPLIVSIVQETLSCATLPPAARGKKLEIGVVLADDALVRTLNRTWRGKDKPTNVLSFPLLDEAEDAAPEIPDGNERLGLGDLVLSLETLERESLEQKKIFREHFMHLVVHGTLHLLGYDHERGEKDAQLMEDTEIWILGRLGCKNPYA